MIHWIEARHKSSSFMIKHSDFEHINLIQGEDPKDLRAMFDYLNALRSMALGNNRYRFLDIISRTFVESSHGDLLWYCKTRPGQERIRSVHNRIEAGVEAWIDEEEVYAADESLLLSRNLQGAQLMKDPSFIPLNPSASTVSALGLEETRALYDVFARVNVFRIGASGPTALYEEIARLEEGAIVLIDGIGEGEPWAFDELVEKLPAQSQLIAFHAHAKDHAPRMLEKRRKGIALAAL